MGKGKEAEEKEGQGGRESLGLEGMGTLFVRHGAEAYHGPGSDDQ